MELTYVDILYASEVKEYSYKEKRDCYKELQDFIADDKKHIGKICALYGLWRTGKTVMMYQCISDMEETESEKCVYLLCKKNCDTLQLRIIIDKLYKEGKRYFFIDEITEVTDFQVYGNVLSDYYAMKKDVRIVIAGTDSLGIMLARTDILYDRIYMIHTSHVSYAEFSRLLGGKTVEEYIEYGGTLVNTQYKNIQAREEYLNTAIVGNIQHSLELNEDARYFHVSLTELYNKKELHSVINKMINEFSYHVTEKALGIQDREEVHRMWFEKQAEIQKLLSVDRK